jgi:hypothetical protein
MVLQPSPSSALMCTTVAAAMLAATAAASAAAHFSLSLPFFLRPLPTADSTGAGSSNTANTSLAGGNHKGKPASSICVLLKDLTEDAHDRQRPE